MSLYDFFFVTNRIGSETSELKSTSENVSAGTWFIHFEGLCSYLNLFKKKPVANFFNSCYFPVQGHVGYYTNLTFSSNFF